MKFNDHSLLIKYHPHAILGASKNTWLSKDADQIVGMCARSYAPAIGTAMHDIARKHIKYYVKMSKFSKKEVYLSLMEDYHIPEYALELGIDWDMMFDNTMLYTNDAIGYRMKPEVVLRYSDLAFGTADAITELDDIFRSKKLRIHDLKTGVTAVHMEQLYIYVALFCLEYDITPDELEIETCIYQKGDIIFANPTAEDIVPIMDKIVCADKAIQKRLDEE